MTSPLIWNGHYVSGSTACAVVRYHGPTDTRGSRWIATIHCAGGEAVHRASVPFEEGPVTAAIAAAAKFGADWTPVDCHSIDSDTYAIGF